MCAMIRAAKTMLVGLALTTALFAAAALGPATIQAQAALGGSGGCYPVDLTWICVYSAVGGGTPGTGARSPAIVCTFAKAGRAVLRRTGTGPPAAGYQWDIMTCPDSKTDQGGQLVQVSIETGVPAGGPAVLLEVGIGALSVPVLPAATAPPRGSDALVGLPEWYWVPGAGWHPVSVTVRAGPVWATATARPTTLTYLPGAGMGAVSCPGPGASFNRSLPAAEQRTRCTYTYLWPSAGQPGRAFRAGVYVTWTISWTGSAGAGGLITSSYRTGTAFAVRVAQAEALVTEP
jgi:hypothetical protein